MLIAKKEGSHFGSLSCFVVIRRNLRHIPKSKLLGAVLFVLSPSSLFCDVPHLTPSDNKTVRIVQNFCNLLTTKWIVALLTLSTSALSLKCSFTLNKICLLGLRKPKLHLFSLLDCWSW